MRTRWNARRWVGAAVVVVVATLGAGCAPSSGDRAGGGRSSREARAAAPESDRRDRRAREEQSRQAKDRQAKDRAETDEFARYAPSVRRHARAAGVNPQLLMAILYNESYKPHDPASERAWARFDDDPSFGVANMHEAAFNDTRRGRPFARRGWQELPDDPDLAIQAAAWYLHDLRHRLPQGRTKSLTTSELLALGYNAGPGNMRAFARGVRPGRTAGRYLDRLRENWDEAGRSLRAGR